MYDRAKIDSIFLCPYCGELLYYDPEIPASNICINPICLMWPNDIISIIDDMEKEEPRIHLEIENEEKSIKGNILNWKPGRLARYSYLARRDLIISLFTQGVMPFIKYFIALGELLLMTNRYPSQGTIDSMDQFIYLLDDVHKWSKDLRNLEDIRTHRIVFVRTKIKIKPLSMKYSRIISEFQQEIGMISNERPVKKELLFPY